MNSDTIVKKDGSWFVVGNESPYELWSQVIEDLYEAGGINDTEYEDKVKILNNQKQFSYISIRG